MTTKGTRVPLPLGPDNNQELLVLCAATMLRLASKLKAYQDFTEISGIENEPGYVSLLREFGPRLAQMEKENHLENLDRQAVHLFLEEILGKIKTLHL
jgi:hypothetical protein